jgi:hypothetical protein
MKVQGDTLWNDSPVFIDTTCAPAKPRFAEGCSTFASHAFALGMAAHFIFYRSINAHRRFRTSYLVVLASLRSLDKLSTFNVSASGLAVFEILT